MTTIMVRSEEELLEVLDNLDDSDKSDFTKAINVAVNPPPSYVSVCRICQALERHDRLVTLNLSGALRDVDNVVPVISFLQRNNSLEELALDDNNFGPSEGIALAHSMRVGGVRKLSLANNRIGDPGASAFRNSRIDYFDLSGNQVGNAGAIKIAENLHVRTLVLADNDIGQQGAIALTNLLMRGSIRDSELSSLNLCNNNFFIEDMLDEVETFLWNNPPVMGVDLILSYEPTRQDPGLLRRRVRKLQDHLNFGWMRNNSN